MATCCSRIARRPLGPPDRFELHILDPAGFRRYGVHSVNTLRVRMHRKIAVNASSGLRVKVRC
jgi:hypothetical protein